MVSQKILAYHRAIKKFGKGEEELKSVLRAFRRARLKETPEVIRLHKLFKSDKKCLVHWGVLQLHMDNLENLEYSEKLKQLSHIEKLRNYAEKYCNKYSNPVMRLTLTQVHSFVDWFISDFLFYYEAKQVKLETEINLLDLLIIKSDAAVLKDVAVIRAKELCLWGFPLLEETEVLLTWREYLRQNFPAIFQMYSGSFTGNEKFRKKLELLKKHFGNKGVVDKEELVKKLQSRFTVSASKSN